MTVAEIEAQQQAERALLGALLIEGSRRDNTAISEVKQKLPLACFSDAQFYNGIHARIFEAMTHCEFPHQIAVAEEMTRTGKLQKGDCDYLVGLVAECPCSLDYMDYAQTILKYSFSKTKPKYKDGV